MYLVHQFYPEYQSGTEKFVHNCALMAQKNGNKVKVVTYGFYKDSFFEQEDEGILSKEFIYQGIPVLAFKYKNQPIDLHSSLEHNASFEFAKRIISTESPDLIHVGHPMRVHQFIEAAREMNVPYIITLTDFFLLCPKIILAPNRDALCSGPQKGTTCKKLCSELSDSFISNWLILGEEILNNARAIISPSMFLANIFSTEYGHLKIHIINHGIRYSDIRANNKKYAIGDKLVFGNAGNLVYHKGVHVLLNAFSAIKNDNIRLSVYGTGDDAYVNKLKDMVKGDNRVSFLGPFLANQLGDIYQGIDVMVTPSVCYENYPFVLHEALASKVPVIGSQLGGIAEKIKEGYNGFTFKPGEPHDLQSKMSLIINDPGLLNKLKENIGKEMIIPNVEQEAYKYFKIYNFLSTR